MWEELRKFSNIKQMSWYNIETTQFMKSMFMHTVYC